MFQPRRLRSRWGLGTVIACWYLHSCKICYRPLLFVARHIENIGIQTFWKNHLFCAIGRLFPPASQSHLTSNLRMVCCARIFCTRTFCSINYIIRAHTHNLCCHTLLKWFRNLFFSFVSLCNVADDVTVVILGHRRSSSITFDQIESRDRQHCDGILLTN